jgi:hypothetical protein
MGRGAVDERGFEAVRRVRQTHSELSLPVFKALVREQFNMLLIDPEDALAAIPSMLPSDMQARRAGFELINKVMSASGKLSPEDRERMSRIARLFGIEKETTAVRNLSVVAPDRDGPEAKAS